MISIYTDGSLVNEKGGGFKPTENSVGAWAFIIVQQSDKEKKKILVEKSGAEVGTTNNKMELIAAIEGLEEYKKLKLTEKEIEICSDSMYLIKGMSQWIHAWLRNEWKNQKGDPVKNKELWLHLLELDQVIKPKYVWVKGHDGNEYNERCDLMCQEAVRKKMESLKK